MQRAKADYEGLLRKSKAEISAVGVRPGRLCWSRQVDTRVKRYFRSKGGEGWWDHPFGCL